MRPPSAQQILYAATRPRASRSDSVGKRRESDPAMTHAIYPDVLLAMLSRGHAEDSDTVDGRSDERIQLVLGSIGHHRECASAARSSAATFLVVRTLDAAPSQ